MDLMSRLTDVSTSGGSAKPPSHKSNLKTTNKKEPISTKRKAPLCEGGLNARPQDYESCALILM